jgi:hypothetical protein
MSTDRPTASALQPAAPLRAGAARPAPRAARLPRPGTGTLVADAHGPLEIRSAGPADRPALRAVAQRDSRDLPDGPLLLAEVAGIPVAAVAVDTGELVADPFWPTAHATAVLLEAAGHRPQAGGRWRERVARRVLRS